MSRHGAKRSHFEGYAAKASRLPELEVVYFGNTLDGVHSYDVYGTPPGSVRQLIGLIKRVDDHKHYAWRNGHSKRCPTMADAVDWIVSRAAETGIVLYP